MQNLEKKIDTIVNNIQEQKPQEMPLYTPSTPTQEAKQNPFTLKEIYEINDFLIYDNEEFINNMYLAILKRPVDDAGLSHHLNLLYSGERTKLEILLSIRYSAEGKLYNVNILGTKKRLLKAALYKTPILGYLVKTAETLLRIPKLLKKINSLEAMLNTKVTPQELKTSLGDIKTTLNQSTQEINKKVNLEDFHKDIATKVDLHDFQEEIEKKVDTRDFQEEIEKKVNLEDFHKDIQEKLSRHEFEQTRDEIQDELQQTHHNLQTEINKKVNLDDFHKDIQQLNHNTEETLKQQSTSIERFAQDIQTANNYLKYVESNLQKLVATAQSTMQKTGETDNPLLNALVEEKEHILDALYLSFEDKFRGSREDIKKRQEYYLPMVQDVITNEEGSLLDIGCGRGEWLELLQENKIKAKGLDLNRLMVQTAQEHGLDVSNGDAIAYLKAQEEESLDVISAFHIVEHLPFEVLIALFDESLRVLKKGGIIIFETPNPENLFVGSCSFYTDPTHINPIPPVTLEFLATNRGFRDVTVHKLHPLKEITLSKETDENINNLIIAAASAQDYSIIGTK